jgi:hypothetical protein
VEEIALTTTDEEGERPEEATTGKKPQDTEVSLL